MPFNAINPHLIKANHPPTAGNADSAAVADTVFLRNMCCLGAAAAVAAAKIQYNNRVFRVPSMKRS